MVPYEKRYISRYRLSPCPCAYFSKHHKLIYRQTCIGLGCKVSWKAGLFLIFFFAIFLRIRGYLPFYFGSSTLCLSHPIRYREQFRLTGVWKNLNFHAFWKCWKRLLVFNRFISLMLTHLRVIDNHCFFKCLKWITRKFCSYMLALSTTFLCASNQWCHLFSSKSNDNWGSFDTIFVKSEFEFTCNCFDYLI